MKLTKVNQKNNAVLGLILLLFVSCNSKLIQENKLVIKYTPEHFTENVRVSGLYFSTHENKLLYTSDKSGHPAAYYYDFSTKKHHLVHSDLDNPIWGLALYSTADNMIYTSVKDGGQYPHIYLKEGDSITDLTPGDQTRATSKGVNIDKSGLYYKANTRDPRVFDLHFYDFQTKKNTLVFKNETGFSVSEISNNNRYVILFEALTEESNKLHLYDVITDKSTSISPKDSEDIYYSAYFSSDDKEFYYLTNHDNEFTYLEKYNVESRKKEIVIKENWDIMDVTLSDDEKYRVININENGSPKIKIQDVVSGKYLVIPALGTLQVTKCIFSNDGNFLAMQVTDYNTPKDIYLLNLKTKKVERIVTSLNEKINENDLIEPIDITLKSFDDLEVPALLFTPKYASKDKKLPALIWTHGGPGGQFQKIYDEYIQYIVNQGYVVLTVNNRGSSGYGKTFKSLDNKRHGVDDLKDCLSGKEYLQSLEYVVDDKIGIIGASYGGYLSLAALTFYPEEFSVGIDMFGISNWFNVLNNTPAYWETRRKALYAEMGDPKADSIMLYNKSPLFFSENITKPLLVVQGANDSRVPQSESDNIVARVRKNGTPVEYLIFDDEGHGVRKPENNIKTLRTISRFLNTYLKEKKDEN